MHDVKNYSYVSCHLVQFALHESCRQQPTIFLTFIFPSSKPLFIHFFIFFFHDEDPTPAPHFILIIILFFNFNLHGKGSEVFLLLQRLFLTIFHNF